MFALLLNAVRADLDRQLGWIKAEAKRQVGHVELTIILIAVASLAGLGAVIIGLIALYVWLAAQTTQFVALGAIGSGLLLFALILLALTRIRRRPQFATPPPLQLAQPAALLGISTKSPNGQGLVGGKQAASLVTGAMRNGSRSALLGTFAMVVLIGVIVGRRAMNRGIDKTRRR
jgi:uncharacterized membrane protein YbhN (UPF0104 family)